MSMPLLTLIVPTYNRADHLERLLLALRSELAGLESQVEVLVSDNASTDRTPEVTTAMARNWELLTVQRHDVNLGPDGNFCSCVSRVTTRYFWIMGDDDCPKRGVLAQVLRTLSQRQPALVYMQSEWLNPVTGPDQGSPVGELHIDWMDAPSFAKAVHVWLTFISGVVVDKTRLEVALGAHTIARFAATHLVQLGWVLPLLTTSGPFAFVHDRCILATKDNSGGYGLLTVFGVNFARIAAESFGPRSPLTRTLVQGNLMHYLPGLTWGARGNASASTHAKENPWPAMSRQLGSHWLYWLLLVPLGRFPRVLALPFFQTWRVWSRLRREWQKVVPKTRGGA